MVNKNLETVHIYFLYEFRRNWWFSSSWEVVIRYKHMYFYQIWFLRFSFNKVISDYAIRINRLSYANWLIWEPIFSDDADWWTPLPRITMKRKLWTSSRFIVVVSIAFSSFPVRETGLSSLEPVSRMPAGWENIGDWLRVVIPISHSSLSLSECKVVHTFIVVIEVEKNNRILRLFRASGDFQ